METADSPNRMKDSFNQMPEKLKPEHGQHRDCYRRFTKYLNCLKSSTEDLETIQQSRTSCRSSTALEKVILKFVSSVIKRGKRRSKRKVFGQLKPMQCLNVKAG